MQTEGATTATEVAAAMATAGRATATISEIGPEQLRKIFQEQRAASRSQPFPDIGQRRQALTDLGDAIRAEMQAIQEAVGRDFGCRCGDETLLTEVMGTLKSITYAKRNLKRWMRPRRRAVDMNFKPATARLIPQPLGVVGIVAPWNYPFGLVMKPLISALAAGNRVMLKPSELTPSVSALIGSMIGKLYPRDRVAVVEGGPRTAQAFCELPFDHLLFTGGTEVGRRVMAAAAANLTPLTLELGGKSPAIIDDRIDMTRVCKSIATGKLLNAGQTCTAPDYVLVPRERMAEFVATFRAVADRMYPRPFENPDYTSIVNERHFARLNAYLDDARARGVEIAAADGGETGNAARRKIAPTLLIDPPETCAIMGEEIFGPLLIVKPYRDLSEAIDYVNGRPRPLALYVFTDQRAVEERVLRETTAGGVTVNDTLLHYTQESLPFGGVGDSGFGAYHGEYGFITFSHMKPIFRQSRLNGLDLLRAPYSKTSKWLLKKIIGMA